MDRPSLQIREATSEDAAPLAAVYRSAYAENRRLGFPAKAEDATSEAVAGWIDEDLLLVAVASGDHGAAPDGDRVIGGVRLEQTDPGWWKLSRLAVHEDRKGEGVGSALLERAEATVRERGGETIWLTTPPEHPYLPGVYESRGFERTEPYPLPYRDYDEAVYEKRL